MVDFLDKFPGDVSGALEKGFRSLTGTEKEYGKLEGPGKLGNATGGYSGIHDYPHGLSDSKNLKGHFIQFQAYRAFGTSDFVPKSNDVIGPVRPTGPVVRGSDLSAAGSVSKKTGDILGTGDLKYTLENTIRLYMPEKIQTGYGAEWDLGEVGLATSAAVDLYNTESTKDFARDLEVMGGQVLKALQAVTNMETVQQLGLDVASFVTNSQTIQNTIQAKTRKIRNPHLEFLFKGVGTRRFEFEFRFTPWNEGEAKSAYEIIKSFKKNMHPTIDSSSTKDVLGVFLKYPNIFKITYFSHGVENLWLHKIGRAALVDMQVDYSSGSTSAFMRGMEGKGSPPTDSTIRLTFAELDILTSESIEDGY